MRAHFKKFSYKFWLCFIIVLSLPSQLAHSYGGEDVLNGRPWHHLDITLRALAGDVKAEVGADINPNGAGFSRKAAMSIAWHADYIDSYLYNPMWWMQDFPSGDRFKASVTMFEDLSRMHHDDTFTTEGVIDNWSRYTSGLLIGLYWAAENGENGDVAAAHNLLGIASHAAQDFYSHSNWMDDPARRSKTWFEYSPAEKKAMQLYTGAYEEPQSQAPKHHGAYSPTCTILKSSGADKSLDFFCKGYSPFQTSGICKSLRACTDAVPVDISVYDIPVTGNTLYMQPVGMALDTTALTRVGANVRGLTTKKGKFTSTRFSRGFSEDVCKSIINFGSTCEHKTPAEKCDTQGAITRTCGPDADYLFAQSKLLAMRTTTQYMKFVEQAVADFDPKSNDKFEKFWKRVKTTRSDMSERTRQFENFRQIPFQFMTAGEYPIANADVPGKPMVNSSKGWFLRMRIKTSGNTSSGTDSDIKLRVKGRNFNKAVLLDYLPTSEPDSNVDNRLLVYNDFEQNDNDVYTVGPFPGLPTSVQVINDSKDAGDVLEAGWDDFVSTVEGIADGLRVAAMSLIGGNADFVGDAQESFTPASIEKDMKITPVRSLTIDGKSEGKYRIKYKKRFVDNQLSDEQRRLGWRAVEFELQQLHCLKESDIDRTGDSDEPFFFVSFAPLNGLDGVTLKKYRSRVFDEVDDNDKRAITGKNKFVIKMPPNGGVVMAAQIWESDDESSKDRLDLWQTFYTGLSEEVREGNGKFIDAFGQSLAEDWRVSSIEILPFNRSDRPVVAPQPKVFRNIGWINGDESKTLNLSSNTVLKLIPDRKPAPSYWQKKPRVIPKELLRNPNAVTVTKDLSLPKDIKNKKVKLPPKLKVKE